MTTAATRNAQEITSERTWFVSFALRDTHWQLGCTTGHGPKPRERTVTAREQQCVRDEIAQATRRCGLPETAPVVRGDAAGRAGCWLQRFFEAHGMTHPVRDSSAIAGSRRQRRATSEGVDVRTLLRLLSRSHAGERQGWPGVTVPSVEAEEQRHRPRDVATLQRQRPRTTARSKGVLRRQGRQETRLTTWPEPRDVLRLGDGSPMPPGLRQRVLRVSAHPTSLREQGAAVETARRAVLQPAPDPSLDTVRQGMRRTGIGSNGAWVVVREWFGGRACKHGRAVGG